MQQSFLKTGDKLMYNVVFLILNYNSYDELMACVKSIRKKCNNYYIVVVDNASKEDEIIKLNKLCEESEDLLLIKNKKNLGFARGNNVGFRYIKKNIKCKYIAMINSDTEIIENGFEEELDKAFEKYKFAVLGPDILPAHSNPMINEPNTLEKVIKEISRTKTIIKIIKIPIVNILYLVFNRLRNKFLVKKNTRVNEICVDCELHGSFLVFSSLFVLDGLCDDTFLYGEEDILAKDCRDNKLRLLYYPIIKILHSESGSTKKTVPDLIERKLFFLNNRLDSLNVLLKKYNQ